MQAHARQIQPRRFTRIPFAARACVETPGGELAPVEFHDIGFGGFSVYVNKAPRPGAAVEFHVPLEAHERELPALCEWTRRVEGRAERLAGFSFPLDNPDGLPTVSALMHSALRQSGVIRP